MSHNFLVEKLIAAVARAFYNDDIVVVFDALIREKYIRGEELGPRLRLPQSDVAGILSYLKDVEYLIKEEEIKTPDSRDVARYYYIDYHYYVSMIRLRVHMMLEKVGSQESTAHEEIYYLCPQCKSKYSELEAFRYRSADNKFICTSCCPDFNFRKVVSQDSFRLIRYDNRGMLSEVQLLERKMKEQLSANADHDGVF